MAKKLICPLMSEGNNYQECLGTDCAWYVLENHKENPITHIKEHVGHCAIKALDGKARAD